MSHDIRRIKLKLKVLLMELKPGEQSCRNEQKY